MKATDEMNVSEEEFEEIDPDEDEHLDDPDKKQDSDTEEDNGDYGEFYDEED